MKSLKLRAVLTGLVITGTLLFASPAWATFPGTNGRIAFAALPTLDAPGKQIYTIEPNGTGLRQLTHLTGDATSPHWSPDGTRIVFERDQPRGLPGRDKAELRRCQRAGPRAGPVHRQHPRHRPPPAHPVHPRRGGQAKLGARWQPHHTDPQRRLPRPPLAERGHDQPRRVGSAVPDPLQRRRSRRFHRVLLPRRAVDRVPPPDQEHVHVRAVQDAARRHPAGPHRRTPVRTPLHRLGDTPLAGWPDLWPLSSPRRLPQPTSAQVARLPVWLGCPLGSSGPT